MTEIQPFTFPTTGQTVRTVFITGEVFFVAKDACDVVGIAKYRDAVAQLDDDERMSAVVDTPGGPQCMSVVNEPGIYALMMISRSPQVKSFRRWVTHEVLPAIRRTGSYSLGQLPQIPATYAEALRAAADQAERAELLATRVAELAPAAHHWNTLATASDDYDVADAAKILSRDPAIRTGRTRLFSYLANAQWIYRTSGHWAPYQRHVDNGRLLVLPQSHYHPRTGELVLDPPQVRITPKGLAELHRRLGGTADVAGLLAEPVAA
jgi:prophage antirepressor-like protein